MSITALIRRMRELGAPPEAVELAVEAIEAEQAKDAGRRAKRAAQKARERARKTEGGDSRATVARQGSDSRSDTSPDGPPPPAPPPPLNPPPSESERVGARDPSDWPNDFREQAWQAYGQGREKKVSIEALIALKRSGKVPWSVFLAGIQRQAEHVEAQFRPSLQRFIKREKWADEYEPAVATGPPSGSAQRSLALVPVNGSHANVFQADRRKSDFAEELARRKAANPYFQRGG